MSEPESSEVPELVPRPYLTDEVTGVGGELKSELADFIVEEIPAYQPGGEGAHFYLWIEKRDVDGRKLEKIVARHFGIARSEVGTAGVKDRRGITRQWVSIPAQQVSGAPETGALTEQLDVLRVSRHDNKLRTGHLWGNRFEIRLRDLAVQGACLEERIAAVAARIEEEGLPNFFGLQRFGHDGSTFRLGWQWARGQGTVRDRFLKKMAASAVQSAVFNRVLARRLREGTWKEALDGDIFEKLDSGGRFWVEAKELAETQQRLGAREIVITGPMPGHKQGLAEGLVGRLEREELAKLRLSEEDLERFKKLGRGTRRALTVFVTDLQWEVEGDTVRFAFSLPAGSYATVLVREFTKAGDF